MARPVKQTVDYFPHDADASNGDTITILEGYFGNDGYAFWFKLLEKLSTSKNHIIDCRNSRKWQLLLAKAHLTEEKGEEIMRTLVDLEAIDVKLWQSQRIIWCQNFVDRVADAYKNRRRPVPTKPVFTEENPITTEGKPQKKRKEKESKTKYIGLPEWIDKEIWGAFLEMRRDKKATPTLRAQELILKELEKLKSAGDDPNEVLEQSIMNGWKGVFPLKGGKSGANRQNPRELTPRESYTRPEDA